MQPQSSNYFPSVGAFAIKCYICSKWRLVPSNEKYAEIRACIIECPFFCEMGREWSPDISCNDRPDITKDGSWLWLNDKPNIPLPPSHWLRLLQIRSRVVEKTGQFADVYYFPPGDKGKLRSTVEVARFLKEFPEYKTDDVDMSQFSFSCPTRDDLTTYARDNEIILSLEPGRERPMVVKKRYRSMKKIYYRLGEPISKLLRR